MVQAHTHVSNKDVISSKTTKQKAIRNENSVVNEQQIWSQNHEPEI